MNDSPVKKALDDKRHLEEALAVAAEVVEKRSGRAGLDEGPGEPAPRRAEVLRCTKETQIELFLNLDGGPVLADTGIGFFTHMLTALATYAGWGLRLECRGDLEVDDHHSVEDIGLVLGQALAEALGDYSGHARFGSSLTPMDDALAEAAVDIGRRPFLHFQVNWPQPVCGQFELCLVEEFWRAVCQKGGLTLHLIGRHGANSHHLAEALFKGAGRALAQALAPRDGGVLSTKGVL
jgi:Imidazoleglycerol-phosphate dehydratase